MIIPCKGNSFLCCRSPRNHMSCNLASVLCVWSIIVVVLVNNGYRLGFTTRISCDIQEYRDMLAIRRSKSIVLLAVKTRNNHAMIERRQVTLWRGYKISEWLEWFPLARRRLTLVNYCLREGDTLPTILITKCWFWELWIYTIRSIGYGSWIRTVCHEIEVLSINRWSPYGEDAPSGYNTTLPVLGWDTSEKWQYIRVWGLERYGH